MVQGCRDLDGPVVSGVCLWPRTFADRYGLGAVAHRSLSDFFVALSS